MGLLREANMLALLVLCGGALV